MNNKHEEKKFRWGYAIFVLFMLFIFGFLIVGFLSIFVGMDVELLSGNVAVIPIEGIITGSSDSEFLFDSMASSPDIIELIEKADQNPNIKAIVLEINSPGGSAVASEEIVNAVKKTNKTTVAWIREVGASGGYWVASSADHVVANRMSITGSIGVIASYLEFPGLLEEYNITYQRLVSGKYKDMGSPFKEMTAEEKAIFQGYLDEMKDYFASEVAANRKMSKKDVDKVANGLFYLGAQAKEYGLIDELGGKQEVINYIQNIEGIEVELVEYRKEPSLLEILGRVMSRQSFFVGRGIGRSLLENKEVSRLKVYT